MDKKKRKLLAALNKSNPQINMQIRAVKLDETARAAATDPNEAYRFEISVSSEFPVYRWGEFEILSHEPGDIRMEWIQSGNAPFLWMHNTNEQLGIVEEFSIENGRGTAVVRFGKSVLAQEKRQDVIDGILVNISVGYRVYAFELVEKSEGETPTYRVSDWEPKEISAVTNPADTDVGFNRVDDDPTHPPTQPKPKEKRAMDAYLKKLAIRLGLDPETATAEQILARHDAETKKTAIEEGETKGRKAATDENAAELARRDTLETIGRECNLETEARAAIDANKTVDEFRKDALEKMRAGHSPLKTPGGLSRQEIKDLEGFSLARYIMGAMGEGMTGLEQEIHTEGQREANDRGMGVGSGYMPTMVIRELAIRAEMHRTARTRAHVAGTDAAGGFLVGSDNIGLVGALKPRLWMSPLGVKMLSGLRNNVTLPGITAEGEAESLTETQSMAGANITLDQRTLSPNRKGTQVTFSLQLLRQSSPQIEAVLSDILFGRVARKYNVDALAFVLALAGTNVVTTSGAPLTRDIMRSFKTMIKADNADERPASWLFNANVEGKLDTIMVGTASGRYLYEEKENGEGRVLSRRALTTSLMADSDILHADFTRMWMGDWGGIDLVRDVVTKAAEGEIVLTANSFVDFAAEHGEFFAKATDVNPAA